MKLLSHVTYIALSTAIATSCATETNKDAHQEGKKELKQSEEFQPTLVDNRDSKLGELDQEAKTLPENVVIRVDLDDNGNEIEGSATMVSLDSATSGESIEADFNAGTSIANNANSDDLEGDSSTNSFYAYNGYNQNHYRGRRTVNRGYGGAAIGHHRGYGVANRGYGYNNSFRGSRYYNNYRPYRRSNVYGGAYWR